MAAIFLFATSSLFAQTKEERAQTYFDAEKIISRLQSKTSTIPSNLQRLAYSGLQFDRKRFDPETPVLIDSRLRDVFTASPYLKMVEAPELARDTRLLKIIGNDSSLKITNTNLPLSDRNGKFAEASKEYQVDGILVGNLMRSPENGLILSLYIFKPNTREIVWSTTTVAREPNEIPAKVRGHSPWSFQFDIVNHDAATYSSFSTDTLTLTSGVNFSSYKATLSYRQAIEGEIPGFVALGLGIGRMKSEKSGETAGFNPMTRYYLDANIAVYLSKMRKAPGSDQFWFEPFGKLSLLTPLPNTSVTMLTPGTNVNLTKNVSIAVYVNTIVGKPVMGDKYFQTTFKRTGYGFSSIIRF